MDGVSDIISRAAQFACFFVVGIGGRIGMNPANIASAAQTISMLVLFYMTFVLVRSNQYRNQYSMDMDICSFTIQHDAPYCCITLLYYSSTLLLYLTCTGGGRG